MKWQPIKKTAWREAWGATLRFKSTVIYNTCTNCTTIPKCHAVVLLTICGPSNCILLKCLIGGECPLQKHSAGQSVVTSSTRSSYCDPNEHTPLLRLCNYWPFFPPATGPGNEPSLRGPRLRVHIQRFPFSISGQPRASRLAHANMLPITQPQLPESHPGWLFPRWRHSVHRLRLLTASDWHHCSHIQLQHWWVIGWKTDNLFYFINHTVGNWKSFYHDVVLSVATLQSECCTFIREHNLYSVYICLGYYLAIKPWLFLQSCDPFSRVLYFP